MVAVSTFNVVFSILNAANTTPIQLIMLTIASDSLRSQDKGKAMKALAGEIQACNDCYKKYPEAKRHIANSIASMSKTGINFWADAFPHYNAKLMIVGQDWGSEGYLETFLRLHGGSIPNPYEENNNRTWSNLMEFLDASMIDHRDVYLTNALLCLRRGKGMSGERNFSPKCLQNCFQYLKRQIEIIRPLVIAALGEKVFRLLSNRYMIKIEHQRYREIVDNYEPEKYLTETGSILFPLFHTGNYGVLNRGNRDIALGRKKLGSDFMKLRDLLSDADEKYRNVGDRKE